LRSNRAPAPYRAISRPYGTPLRSAASRRLNHLGRSHSSCDEPRGPRPRTINLTVNRSSECHPVPYGSRLSGLSATALATSYDLGAKHVLTLRPNRTPDAHYRVLQPATAPGESAGLAARSDPGPVTSEILRSRVTPGGTGRPWSPDVRITLRRLERKCLATIRRASISPCGEKARLGRNCFTSALNTRQPLRPDEYCRDKAEIHSMTRHHYPCGQQNQPVKQNVPCRNSKTTPCGLIPPSRPRTPSRTLRPGPAPSIPKANLLRNRLSNEPHLVAKMHYAAKQSRLAGATNPCRTATPASQTQARRVLRPPNRGKACNQPVACEST